MLWPKAFPPFYLEFFLVLGRATDFCEYVDASTQTPRSTPEETVEEQTTGSEDAEEPALANSPKKERDNGWLFENANTERLVWQLGVDDIQQSINEVTIKSGYELLCSYSWKNTDTPDAYGPPVIYVPGTPATFDAREFTSPAPPTTEDVESINFDLATHPYWTWLPAPPSTTSSPKKSEKTPKEPSKSIHLPPDTGRHWLDQHAARSPTHQFEPLFQALSILTPAIRFNTVDIIVNRNTLQSLLKFITAKSSQALRLDLDVVGSTLFIGWRVRHAKTGSAPGSYGRSFEAYFTAEDQSLQGADGHHRVLRYGFGKLDVVVRIEVDAYIPKTAYNVDEAIMLHPVFDAELSPAEGIAHAHQTAVIPAGTLVPHFLTVELKSNDKERPLDQMWLGRTPKLYVGRQKGRVFEAGGGGEGDGWGVCGVGNYESGEFEILEWLLGELREVTIRSGGATVLVAMGKGMPMEVFEVERKVGALPGEIVQRFWDELM